MSNLQNQYQLTAKIHKLLPRVKAKYGLEFEVDLPKTFGELPVEVQKIAYERALREPKPANVIALEYPPYEAPQLRQILVGLQGVLGIYTVQFSLDKWCNYKIWNDDVDTLFNRDPILVLTDLVEILENLLK